MRICVNNAFCGVAHPAPNELFSEMDSPLVMYVRVRMLSSTGACMQRGKQKESDEAGSFFPLISRYLSTAIVGIVSVHIRYDLSHTFGMSLVGLRDNFGRFCI